MDYVSAGIVIIAAGVTVAAFTVIGRRFPEDSVGRVLGRGIAATAILCFTAAALLIANAPL